MSPRILVVDDEPCIRTFVQRVLETAGWTVSCAGCAREALTKASEVAFDMMISDIVMPGGDGIQLARSLTALQPNMAVILMTGFDKGLSEFEPRWKVISKPFRLAELTAMVAAHLKSQFGKMRDDWRPESSSNGPTLMSK